MNSDIQNTDWASLFALNDLDKCYDILVKSLLNLCEKYVPKCRPTVRSRPPWLTSELKRLIREKHIFWYRMRSSKNSDLKMKYKIISRRTNEEIINSIVAYEHNLAENSKSDPKLVYSYIKSKQCVKEQIRALVDGSGRLETDRERIADILNLQFKSVFVTEPSDHDLPHFEQRRVNAFGIEELLETVQEKEIELALSKLNSDKTSGGDDTC